MEEGSIKESKGSLFADISYLCLFFCSVRLLYCLLLILERLDCEINLVCVFFCDEVEVKAVFRNGP